MEIGGCGQLGLTASFHSGRNFFEITHFLVFHQSVLGYLLACPMFHFIQQEVNGYEDAFNTNVFSVDKGKCTKIESGGNDLNVSYIVKREKKRIEQTFNQVVM